MDETKKSAPREGGEKRSRSRRGRRDGKPRPAQGAQPQQAKFDPHFLTGAETAVLPAKTVAAAPDKQRPAPQNSQQGRPAKGGQAPQQRPGRDSRPSQPEGKKAGRSGGKNQPKPEQPARPENSSRSAARSAAGERGRGQAGRAPAPKGPAPSQPKGRPGRPARETRSDDPGLVLISRRPPQQKFSSFEEYMAAHGGATAPIEDHSEDYE